MKDPIDPGTIDLFGGKADRDAGMKKTADKDPQWMELALHHIQWSLRYDWQGSGQDIRIWLTDAIGPPHHHNTWGALIAQAIRKGYLVRTGHQKHARIRASHARRNDVYRRCT